MSPSHSPTGRWGRKKGNGVFDRAPRNRLRRVQQVWGEHSPETWKHQREKHAPGQGEE